MIDDQPKQPQVITRFAPSPTGYLHIGGARTALFNWLYAKHFGGKMLLRIEDTDRVRHTKGAVDAILDGLTWLGLDWDGDVISQFSRVGRHKEVAEQLLQNNKAYQCYCTSQDIAAARDQAKVDNRPYRHRCQCHDAPPSKDTTTAPPVIRLKAPRDGTTVIHDMVKGTYEVKNTELDDLVLVRSDGTPTYMLAVVVDDHDMGVTHIIRGNDHSTNAAKQTLIYQAMNWKVPQMGHIPLIHGMDGAKLSKRHGATGAEAYRAMGYLPQAMRNYLARLGWSRGDDEIMSTEQLIQWFDLDAINQSPSRLDVRKLNSVNGHYTRTMNDADLLQQWKVCLNANNQQSVLDWLAVPSNETVVLQALPALKQRSKTLVDLTESASYLWRQRPLDIDAKALKVLNNTDAKTILADLHKLLTASDDWTADSLEVVIKAYANDKSLKLAQVAQPIRAALTGRTASRGIYDVLVDLGHDESLHRIMDQCV